MAWCVGLVGTSMKDTMVHGVAFLCAWRIYRICMNKRRKRRKIGEVVVELEDTCGDEYGSEKIEVEGPPGARF